VLLYYLEIRFKNYYNQNKYSTKAYLLKQISINLRIEIKFRVVFNKLMFCTFIFAVLLEK